MSGELRCGPEGSGEEDEVNVMCSDDHKQKCVGKQVSVHACLAKGTLAS
jgi:hypothetical protein